jgi:hypothetical protein
MATINHLALLFLGFDESYIPTQEELEQAFKNASFRCHPDTGGNVFMFRGLVLAKEIVEGNLQVAKKPQASSSKSKSYSRKQTSDERIRELHNEISHWARMATINLCGGTKRVKEITVTAEGIGTLTVSCTNKWEVDSLSLPSIYHKNEDVLVMFKLCLNWISDKPRETYKQGGHATFQGREINIQFDYEFESSWDHFNAFFHNIF